MTSKCTVRFLGGPLHWELRAIDNRTEFLNIPVYGANDYKYRLIPPGIYSKYYDAIAIPAKFDSLWEWRGSPSAMKDQGKDNAKKYLAQS